MPADAATAVLLAKLNRLATKFEPGLTPDANGNRSQISQFSPTRKTKKGRDSSRPCSSESSRLEDEPRADLQDASTRA